MGNYGSKDFMDLFGGLPDKDDRNFARDWRDEADEDETPFPVKKGWTTCQSCGCHKLGPPVPYADRIGNGF